MTLALQPSGLQSQGQPPAQFASPTEQVSQYFALPVLAPQFTPCQTGFTLGETSSLLVPETTVSRSLGASFSELTGQPTLPYLHVPGPSTVTPIIGTIKMLPSLVASSEPAASVIPAQPTVAPVPDPTQTASASLPATEGQTAQSLGSDDDGTQFQLAPRTSAPGSSAAAPPTDP